MSDVRAAFCMRGAFVTVAAGCEAKHGRKKFALSVARNTGSGERKRNSTLSGLEQINLENA